MIRTQRRGRRRPSSSLLERIASLVTRRSRLVIGIWIVAVGVLATLGRDLNQTLTIHPPFVDGTQSKRAHERSQREFGGDNAMDVMLRGPRAQVERQGRDLASHLDAMPNTLAISPWARGARVEGLNPSPGVAAIIVRNESNEENGGGGLLPLVKRQSAARISGPVRT